jgi:hypothetical protein
MKRSKHFNGWKMPVNSEKSASPLTVSNVHVFDVNWMISALGCFL